MESVAPMRNLHPYTLCIGFYFCSDWGDLYLFPVGESTSIMARFSKLFLSFYHLISEEELIVGDTVEIRVETKFLQLSGD